MKINHFTILLFVFYLFEPTQLLAQPSEMSPCEVIFLDKEDGQVAILDETYEPYFSQLQIREISAFIGMYPPTNEIKEARDFARKKFSEAVTDFTANEQEVIQFTLEKVVHFFSKLGNNVFATHPWKLIKIEDWLCGGFAHTRGEYIILSQRHLDHLSSDWNEEMTVDQEKALISKLGGLLIHEQMHALQRRYEADFAAFYRENWGYQKAKVHSDSSIILNQVSNPDAPVANWLIPAQNNTHYWIRTLLQPTDGIPQMGKDFINKVFIVSEVEEGRFKVEKNQDGVLKTVNMEALQDFTESFPEVALHGIDHPNEISAYMMADFFQDLYNSTTPFADEDPASKERSDAFVDWVEHKLINLKNSR